MNPYKIAGPAVISFSGGRTSGYMLCKIVEAHGGCLPSNVVVLFANTGLEHEATYEFVQQVSERVAPVTWLEYERIENTNSYKVVGYDTASRNGEPMESLIDSCNYLPNPAKRFCTIECKIRTIARYVKDRYEWDSWTEAVGLRYDEPRRVHRIRTDQLNRDVVCPMYSAGHGLQDVLHFWRNNDFDLKLPADNTAFGNCVGCFLKGNAKRMNVFRDEPTYADWWVRMEDKIGARFRKDTPPYRQLLDMAVNQQSLMFDEDDLEECNCTD